MSTSTRCLPEGQWVREAGSTHDMYGTTPNARMRQ